ncbi:hypothetical protein M9458_053474, partial [Cirrhinus mrigala]
MSRFGDVSALNDVTGYFTSRDEGSDDEVTKEESSDDESVLCTVREQLRCARFYYK